MSAERTHCEYCGAAVQADARFCGACGRERVAQPAAIAQEAGGTPLGATAIGTAPSAPGSAPVDSGGPAVAPLVHRVAALALDAIAFVGVWAVVGVLLAERYGGTTASGVSLQNRAALLWSAITTLVFVPYAILLEGTIGATLGKLVLGLRVVRTDGRRMGLGAAVVRNLLRVVDGIAFYLVGFAVAVNSPLKQRLGDMAARTIVVARPSSSAAVGGALVAALLLAAAGIGAAITLHEPPETVVTATLARDVTDDNEPVDPTTSFPANAEILYIPFKVTNAREGSVLSVALAAIETGRAPVDTTDAEDSLTLPAGNRTGHFFLSQGEVTWPPGRYEIRLSLDGEQVVVLPFSVFAIDPTVTATLARDHTPDYKAVNPTTSFPANATAIALVFQTDGAPEGSVLRIAFYSISGGGATAPNSVVGERSVKMPAGDPRGGFRLHRGTATWSPGSYEARIFLDDKQLLALPFTLVAAGPTPAPARTAGLSPSPARTPSPDPAATRSPTPTPTR